MACAPLLLLLRTARLVLRPLEDTDWQAVGRIGGQPQMARMMCSLRSPWAEEDARAWIAASAWRGTPGFRLAVCLTDGPLIGTVGLGPEPEPSCTYFIDPDHAGQGYATEAMQALVAEVIPRFGLSAITAEHFADNPASGRVLEKLGFRKTGETMGNSGARPAPAPLVRYRLEAGALRTGRRCGPCAGATLRAQS
jgi:RimJ/RimL family protein N-acetyltransferase